MRMQSTTAESWKPAVQLALAFAAIKFAIEFIGNLLAQHFGYGIFRDEMYYIVCGRHLAWGYVDQAPMVALQARIAEMLFGFRHLALFRSFSALAGAVKSFPDWNFGVAIRWQADRSSDGDDCCPDCTRLSRNRQLSFHEFVRAGLLDGMHGRGASYGCRKQSEMVAHVWRPWRDGSAEQAIHGVFPCRPSDRSSTHSSTADTLEPMDTCSCRSHRRHRAAVSALADSSSMADAGLAQQRKSQP